MRNSLCDFKRSPTLRDPRERQPNGPTPAQLSPVVGANACSQQSISSSRWSDCRKSLWSSFVNNVKGGFSGAAEAAETRRGCDVSNVCFPRLCS